MKKGKSLPEKGPFLPPPSPALADCVRGALIHQRQRVFPLVWEGQTLWIKRAIPSKRKVFHQIQALASGLLSWHTPMIKPSFCTGGSQALVAEAHRLQVLEAAGISVPQVVAFQGQWMALSHKGVALSFVLENHRRSNPDKDPDRLQFLLQAAQALMGVHNKGFCLGSGRLRDIVYDGSQFSFIDGEEDPSQVMALPAAQGRDILFFMLTALRHFSHDSMLILALWACFLKEASPVIMEEIQKLRPYLRILGALDILPPRWWGRDMKEAILWARILLQN
jgi:tRNA A-37 threonylcarbamoyl transferase component Bud32